MKLICAATELAPAGRPVCAAIGVFDGVHLGHQQVIRQALAGAAQNEALAVVVTFDRHPNAIVAPARLPPLIQSLPQKLRAIAGLGADTVLLLAFDEAFSRVSGGDFIRGLARDFGRLQSVCVGSDFHFGHKRSGNVELLRQLGGELRFLVHGLAAVSLDGHAVSSTRIREAIRAGRLDDAGQMLGRPWSLAGPVVPGAQRGHKLGFPTANLDIAGLALPPEGVYAAHVLAAGQTHRAVVNIGVRPTVADAQTASTVEAHLLDFSGDLYGAELEITFAARLREERKFSSLEALREQIARDIASAREMFGR